MHLHERGQAVVLLTKIVLGHVPTVVKDKELESEFARVVKGSGLRSLEAIRAGSNPAAHIFGYIFKL